MPLRLPLALLIMTVFFGSPAAAQQPRATASLRLSRLFSDGMVMQRGTPVPVWGWCTAGTPVTVTFDDRPYHTSAEHDGRWTVTLPAMTAGGPHTMSISAGTQSIALRDVLVGDVWLASGQSNMEWTVSDTKDAANEIAAARDTRIRQFKVPTSYANEPSDDLAGGSWTTADQAHVGGFTAVGYFFARDVRKSVDVPIGILHTSWGGSRIEPWMSRGALAIGDAEWSAIVEREAGYAQRVRDALRARIGELPTVDAGFVDGQARWADPALDDSRWSSIATPKSWEQVGYEGMDGVAWYRTSFTLSDDDAARAVRVGLGTIDDADIAWVNGVEVGHTSGWNRTRVYDVPASALRAGRNVIAVRVEDTGGGGGIYGDPALLFVDVGGAKRPLAGEWKFKIGAVTVSADGQHINKIPTVLYNKMIHPVTRYPIAGVIWYQGESNADRLEDAVEYRALFPTLITSWRKEWGLGDIPFLWVQLANYMAPDAQPVAQSAWATLREAQTAALALPNTGQAVIIDLGEEKDVHPRNKQDVGARLALVARKVAYGQTLVASGPMPGGHEIQRGAVVVQFTNVGAGLVSRGTPGHPGGFAIAGADRRFVWADARIDGERVSVSSAAVPNPVAVRYGWGNNPQDATLYNADGMPATPFRTDAW